MRRVLPRSPGARAVVAVVAFFVVLNVVVLAVSLLAPEPSGEDGSAYATQPRGAAAYAELLRRDGHIVSYLREPLSSARLNRARLLVVLDASELDDGERSALSRFVRDGGHLVSAGANAGAGIVEHPPRWSAGGPRSARPPLPLPETLGVRTVASAGEGGFDDPGAGVVALGGDRGLLVIAPSGRGRALLLADASVLQNRLLGQADNAALGLALAGRPQRRVVFVESIHGFGEQTGLAALPLRWRFALVLAALAALLWMASRGRRLGPPEDSGGEPPPARREHVEALALALKRSGEPAVALEPVQAAARAQVIRRASLPHDAPDAAVREAALGLGLGEDEAAALVGERSSDTALALGRALAKGRS